MPQEQISPEVLDALERMVESVRNQFELYFLGIRKTPPLQDRADIQAKIRKYANYTITNTRVRFRFEQLVAKFNAYNTYWNRTLTQIEEGRYFRDRFKMKLHAGPVDETPSPGTKGKKEKPAEGKEAEKPAVPEEHIDQVYQDFLAAKKQLNQPANISREKIAETITKQMTELQKRFEGKEIRFRVVIEDGKAKLKATVK